MICHLVVTDYNGKVSPCFLQLNFQFQFCNCILHLQVKSYSHRRPVVLHQSPDNTLSAGAGPSRGSYVERRENVIFIGSYGTGKPRDKSAYA
jgi:hypothetical protein